MNRVLEVEEDRRRAARTRTEWAGYPGTCNNCGALTHLGDGKTEEEDDADAEGVEELVALGELEGVAALRVAVDDKWDAVLLDVRVDVDVFVDDLDAL